MTGSRFAQLIQGHLPGLRIESLRELSHIGWGGDSDAVLVNGDL